LKDKRDFRDYLLDILRYAEIGERITIGVDFETFCSNEEKALSAVQVLEIIGEASKGLPKSLKNRYPEVPWSEMAATRDKLIHAYHLVDLEVVWRTLKEDIPPLKKSMTRILDDIGKEGFKPKKEDAHKEC
jgi:uncharacterized protein with HEPN domain